MMRYFFFILLSVAAFAQTDHNMGSYAIITDRSTGREDQVYYASEAAKAQARDGNTTHPPRLLQIGQMYIMADNLPAADGTLRRALKLDPSFNAARLQLAYVQLWEADYGRSLNNFLLLNQQHPCNKVVLKGLKEIGTYYSFIPRFQKKAIPIYEILVKCEPADDFTKYKLSVLYGQAGRWDDAERVALDILDDFPEHTDAELQLARVHRHRKDFHKAREILHKHPELSQAREQLGFIELSRGKYRDAQAIFADVLADDPNASESWRGLGVAYKGQRGYRLAQPIFQNLIYDQPDYDILYRYMFDTLHHTRPSLDMGTRYTLVNEGDFFTRRSVVKYWYWDNQASFIFPPTDRLTFVITPFYGQEKQFPTVVNDVTNYNVRKFGGTGEATYEWADVLTLRGGARLKRGQQIGSALFPFVNSTQFEPFYTIRLDNGTNILSTTGYFDSFIIRELDDPGLIRPSRFLSTKSILGLYEFRPDIYLRPYVGAIVTNTYYNIVPNNKSILRSGYGSIDMPHLEEYFRLSYIFEYESYDTVSPNYQSFRRQYNHDLGITFTYSWSDLTRFFFRYDHQWEKTVDLSQQLNVDAAFIPLANIHINRYEAELVHQVKERLQITVGGYYYHSTFPIDVYNLHLNLWWQF